MGHDAVAPLPSPQPASTLLSLPPELLLHLLTFVPLPSLASLARTNRHLHDLVASHSFRRHAVQLAYAPLTVAHAHHEIGWSAKAGWCEEIRDAWESWDISGEVLRRDPSRGSMPVVMGWERKDGWGRVVVGRGARLSVWEVDEQGTSWEVFEGSHCAPRATKGSKEDLTGILAVKGAEDELVLSTVSGAIKRVRLSPTGRGYKLVEVARYLSERPHQQTPTTIQSIASSGSLFFAISTTKPRPKPLPVSNFADLHALPPAPHSHKLSIYNVVSPWVEPRLISLDTKPWSVFASPSWLAVGCSGSSPLSLFSITSTGDLLPSSTAFHSAPTSIYALASPTPLSTLRSDATLITASFDSLTRLYDLRSPFGKPRMELCDPNNDDPCYSVASGGPGGTYVVVGTSRNSALRIFDVRSPSVPLEMEAPVRGGTFFAPSREMSPVYGVVVEYSRVWGVGEKTNWCLEFGGRRRGEIGFYRYEEGGLTLRKSGGGGAMER